MDSCNFGLSTDGKAVTSKETIVAGDKENKSFTYKMLEGDYMKIFKTLEFELLKNVKAIFSHGL